MPFIKQHKIITIGKPLLYNILNISINFIDLITLILNIKIYHVLILKTMSFKFMYPYLFYENVNTII